MNNKGGRIAANFRRGNLGEDLAIQLFRPFCAVANVPREEDYGIDFIGTLLRKNGRVYSAEDSFIAQVKVNTSPVFSFEGEGVDWLKNLKLPYFPITVNVEENSVSVYSLNQWHHPIFTSILTKYNFCVTGEFYEGDGHDDFNLGDPIMKWTIQDIRHPAFQNWAFKIMKEIIQIESENFLFGELWRFKKFSCDTFKFDSLNPEPQLDNIIRSTLEIPPGIKNKVEQILNRAFASFPSWVSNQVFDEDKSQTLLDIKKNLLELNFNPDPSNTWEIIAEEMKEYFD
ncbi:hypothetical protein [Jiulongibacter sediminis]|uniref:DUF4365 domain-containing protein n=1 Tax=Jiulongibacter sediminis TaxID=1605367 RepID=A0A0P7C5X8_9BACT|nr:hypothetical protein [Jiulongibacter sediminis]KPM47608.1 hypothetical protein AFM12_14020 [Jiulongibacter sediminis]TBX23399.1 hypothetical protein TK44_14030 [Jiulongibacter sediminis]